MSSPSFNQDYPGKWGWHSKMDSREVDCNTDPSCVACFEVKRIWIGGAMYSLINSRNCPMHITANESFSNNWQQHQVRHFCKIWWCTTFCKQMWEDHAGNSMLNATRWPDHIVDVNFQRNEQEHKEMSVVSDTLERNDMTHEQLLASAGEISKWDLARNCCSNSAPVPVQWDCLCKQANCHRGNMSSISFFVRSANTSSNLKSASIWSWMCCEDI